MPEQKRALVVDDSKSARVVLRRMLEKHALSVDTVESAQEALEFLARERPDVIFMDHMMPAMNGFEAIKAIKADPRLGGIPILMYTSMGGDLYLDRALEAGAVGVLHKTVSNTELFDALQLLGLADDRRQSDQPLAEDDASERAIDIQQRSPQDPQPFYEPDIPQNRQPLDPEQLDTHVRRLLEEQRVEIRKDLLLGMETVSKQVGNKLHKELDDRFESLNTQPRWVSTMQALPILVLVLLLFLSMIWNYSLFRQMSAASATHGSATGAHAADQESLEKTITELKSLQVQTLGLLAKSRQSVAWAMNQTLRYAYDEIALDNQRVDVIAELLERLSATGFRGKIILETHVGEFCLLGDQENGFRLPAPDMSVDQCDYIGNHVQPTDSPATHQSLQFANFVTSTPLLSDGPISLEVVAASRAEPQYPYPERSAGTTAREWNEVAAKNNRVVIRLDQKY